MRNLHFIIALLLASLTLFSYSSQAKEQLLNPEQAFQLVELVNPNEIILQWKIADNYYLYQNRIKVFADGVKIAINNFPKAKLKYDEYFGEINVYYHTLNLPIQVPNIKQLKIHYQGCSDTGLCYPLQTSIINLDPVITATSIDKTYNLSSNNFDVTASDFKLLQLLTNGNMVAILSLFFLIGIITAFAGCSYPMFPILSKIIVGEGKDITRIKACSLSFTYVLSIAIVYAILGIIAGSFGSNLSNWFQHPIALLAVAIVLITMALSMFGLYELQIPNVIQSKFNQFTSTQKGGSYFSAISMGVLSSFLISACTVPPIVAAITYITQTGDILLGASAMFLFGLGLGFPLLVLGLSASWLLPKAGAWMHNIQKIIGVLLLSAAIYIIDRISPAWITLILSALLTGSVGLTLILNSQKIVFNIFGGLFFALAGALLIQLSPQSQPPTSTDQDFHIINSVAELNNAIQTTHKSIFIEYYADWCNSCVKMKNKVYPLPNIQTQLKKFTLLKIDLTHMTVDKESLMHSQQVIGPPAILFLQANGEELRELRITGKISAKQFSDTLKKVSSKFKDIKYK